MSQTHPATWREEAMFGGVSLLAAAAAQLMSIGLWMPEPRSHMVWLPGAFALCALIAVRNRAWPACILGAIAGIVATLAAIGLPLSGLILIASGDLLLVAVAASLLRRFAGDKPFESLRAFYGFVLLCGVVLPAIGAWWAVEIAERTDLDYYLGRWGNVALAHSIANLLVVPAFTSYLDSRRRRDTFSLTRATVGVTLLLVLWGAWSALSGVAALLPLLTVAPAPLLVWSLLFFRTFGACLAMLSVGLLGLWLSVAGDGPFIQQNFALTTLAAQLWVACVAIALLYFLATLAERRRQVEQAQHVADSEISRMTGRLISAQEDERTSIARDLHDDVSQSLASVSIHLSAMKYDADAAMKEQLERVQHDVIGVSRSIRRLSHQLHPSVLRYTGLVPALRDLCESYRLRGGPEFHSDLPKEIALPDAHALCLYRIAQEALGNAERHASASRVVLSLQHDAHSVTLTVTDNGVGLDRTLAGNRSRRGLGLISMEERARMLNGSLQVSANGGGGGSKVCIVLPIDAHAGLPRLD